MEEHGDGDDSGNDGAGIIHPHRPTNTNKNDNGSSEPLPPEVWAVVMECKCKLCCVVYIIIYDYMLLYTIMCKYPNLYSLI